VKIRITEFPIGSLVAIPLSWSSGSGCVEWRLAAWTVPNDVGQSLPILDDGWGDGEPEAWGDDYAIKDPKTGMWVFPDGERSDDEGLVAAFARRQARHRARSRAPNSRDESQHQTLERRNSRGSRNEDTP
jgi:hypothetical protein